MNPRLTINRACEWYGYKLLSRLCHFHPENNLLLCAAPRGGSTWLSELLHCIPRTVILNEPLALSPGINGGSPFRRLDFWWRQYIPKNATWPDAREAFDEVLRGRFLNTWTCAYANFAEFLTAERMIVKLCRANALLPWLTNHYRFKFAPIYLVRHPFAVVASQLAFSAWRFTPGNGYPASVSHFREFYQQHAAFLATVNTKEEFLTTTWCLANSVPLKQGAEGGGWITVHYEKLLLNPEEELGRIFARWGLPMPDSILERVSLASATTQDATFKKSVGRQLTKWQSSLDRRQRARMMRVLDYFEIERYNGVDPLPLTAISEREACE